MADVTREPIPFLDLKRQHATIGKQITRAVDMVMAQCSFSSGPPVAAFEEQFARYCGVSHCVGVNSGTSALHLALIAAGVRPGDEVITPAMTFVATAWAIMYIGARPVFVDIEHDTCTLDVNQAADAITPRTRAIIPVHLYGQPADMSPLLKICRHHGLALVEDASQAHGARYKGKKVGTMGLAGSFSFYPGKNLGACGEGGAITTNEAAVAARARRLRDHARTGKNRHDELGYNYRMDSLQAAILSVKLRYLDDWNRTRLRRAARYRDSLAQTPLLLPNKKQDRDHVWHLFVVRHPLRDRLHSSLGRAGIDTGLHYPTPVHLQPATAHLGHKPGEFPVAEKTARECLSLPIFPELRRGEQDRIAEVIQGFPFSETI